MPGERLLLKRLMLRSIERADQSRYHILTVCRGW